MRRLDRFLPKFFEKKRIFLSFLHKNSNRYTCRWHVDLYDVSAILLDNKQLQHQAPLACSTMQHLSGIPLERHISVPNFDPGCSLPVLGFSRQVPSNEATGQSVVYTLSILIVIGSAPTG